MFGRWLKLPRDGPDLLGALLPIVRSTSGRTTIGGGARCTPSAAPLETKALALRARDRGRPPVPKLDRQLAIGLLSSRFSEELSL